MAMKNSLVILKCPECGYSNPTIYVGEVIYCPHCGFCRHTSWSGQPDGTMACDDCGTKDFLIHYTV